MQHSWNTYADFLVPAFHCHDTLSIVNVTHRLVVFVLTTTKLFLCPHTRVTKWFKPIAWFVLIAAAACVECKTCMNAACACMHPRMFKCMTCACTAHVISYNLQCGIHSFSTNRAATSLSAYHLCFSITSIEITR